MDARIILAGQQPDIVNVLGRAAQSAGATNQVMRQNALSDLYQQMGPQIAAGDQNALARYAQLAGPEAAMGIQSQRQEMQINDAQLAEIRQRTKLAVQKAAADNDAQAVAARTEAAKRVVAMAAAAGDPARAAEILASNPDTADFAQMPIGVAIAAVQGADDALKAAAERLTPKKTTNMIEYEAAQSDPGFAAHLQSKRPQTNVNVNTGEGNNFGLGYWEEQYGNINDSARAASDMLGMYDLAESALDTGVRTGVGGESELALRRLGAIVGVGDADKLAGGELIRAVQNRMALIMRSPDGGMGMPGAVSDRDIQFLKDAQIGIDRSPEGNRKMITAYRAIEQRKIDVARLADAYIAKEGRLDGGFSEVVRQFAENNSMFDGVFDSGSPTSGATQALDDLESDPEIQRLLEKYGQ